MRIVVSNTSNQPIYQQIKDQIKSAILSGELNENAALPSLRRLAAGLKISLLTTTRAYRELEQEGFITSVQGKGCYVAPRGGGLVREQLLKEIRGCFDQAIAAAEKAGIPGEELVGLLEDLLAP